MMKTRMKRFQTVMLCMLMLTVVFCGFMGLGMLTASAVGDGYVFTQPPTAVGNLTYNGAEQTLVNAGVATDGTVQYRLNGESWETALPVAIDAGTYTVEYRIYVSESEIYAAGSLEVTLGKKEITPEIEELNSPYYEPNVSEEAPARPTFILTADGETIAGWNYNAVYTNNTAIGTATVTVVPYVDGNYSFAPVSKDFTIVDHIHQWEYSVDATQKNIAYATCVNDNGGTCVENRRATITLSASNAVYDGTPKEATMTTSHTLPGSWGILYIKDGDIYFDSPREAGKYRAEVSLSANLDPIYVEYEIAQKELTLEWSNTTLTYNGGDQLPTATITGGVLDGDRVTVTVIGAQTDAGTYTATAELDNPNYTVPNPTASFTIDPITLTLEWSNTTLTYNGEDQLPTATITGGVLDGDEVTVTVLFDGSGSANTAQDVYYATAQLDNPNYTASNAQQTFSIEALVLPLPVIDAVTYNGSHQTADLSATQFYSVTTNDGGVNAGEYDVVLRLKNFPNVKWEGSDQESVTLKIRIEKQTLSAPAFEAHYSGETQIAELPEGAPYEFVTNEGGVNMGEYDVTLRLTDTVNYEWETPDLEDPTLTAATFTITKAENAWIIEPILDDWRFGDAPSVPIYAALYGNETVKIVYDIDDVLDGTESPTPPTLSDTYYAHFIVEEGDSYEEMVYTVEFDVLEPCVTIGGWALPKLHYMNTSGIISKTQPEGGYAYVRADGTLLLKNFVIDTSVFEAIDTTDQTYEYAHLLVWDPSDEAGEDSMIRLLADTTVQLIGESRLTGYESDIAIGAFGSSLTLRGGSLYTDGAILFEAGLTLESCSINAVAFGGEAVTATSSKIFVTEYFFTDSLTLSDCTVDGGLIIAEKNVTVENSVLKCGGLHSSDVTGLFGEVTVRNSSLMIEGIMGIGANKLLAEDSIFVIKAEQGYAISADFVSMTNCDVTIPTAVLGIIFEGVELTDCSVTAECSKLFQPTGEDASSNLVLNNCEIEAIGTDEIATMIDAERVEVNGGKLTLTSNGIGELIVCLYFSATDAEIDLTYGENGITAYEINIERTKLTVGQSKEATLFGTAVCAWTAYFIDSSVTVTGGMIGIAAEEYLVVDGSQLNIRLEVPEGATALPLPAEDGGDGEEPAAPVYMGIATNQLDIYGTDSTLTVTIPEDAEGAVIRCVGFYFDEGMAVTSPEGATFTQMPLQEGYEYSFYELVVRDGETETYPKSVTVSYVAPEEPDGEEPEEDKVFVGGVELENGKYLDNNGKLCDGKPEGGYAHLLDGVLTLHDFTYYGVGYLFDTYEDETSDFTVEYYAGIFSTQALTLRVEGKNLLDLKTFASDLLTYGAVIRGDLTVEGDGTLKLFATDDGIEVWGALTVSDCRVEMNTGSEGFDIYGKGLFEDCELVLQVEDDGIWADDDVKMVNCTVEILSTGNDCIYSIGDITLLDCTFNVTADDDGIDAEGELLMIGCEAVIVSNDSGIEVDYDVEITDCVLSITAGDYGIHGDDENITLTDCTVEITADDDGIYTEDKDLTLIGCTLTVNSAEDAIYAYGTIRIEDCTLTLYAFEDAIYSDEYSAAESVLIRDSHVTVGGADYGIYASNVSLRDSRLEIRASWSVINAEAVRIVGCEGDLTCGDDRVIDANSVVISGGDLELSGYGLISAYYVLLSNCELHLDNWSYDAPAIETASLAIEGKNTRITCIYSDFFVGNNGDVFELDIDSELILWDLEYGYEVYLNFEDGYVYETEDPDSAVVSDFVISMPLDETDGGNEGAWMLVIGDKELCIGDYLDNAGNVTDRMPAGGFAYFNGSELILKDFTYVGVGGTLRTLNGEEVTAGIYSHGGLTVRLIGSNSLKFTSDATVGITLGNGDLTIVGDGSLTLDTTGEGILLTGNLSVQQIALTVNATDLGVEAANMTFLDATVTVNATGEAGVVGIRAIGAFDVTESKLTVLAESKTDEADQTVAILCVYGRLTLTDSLLNVTASDVAILANAIALSEGLIVLVPENGVIEAVDNGYSILDVDGVVAKQLTVGAAHDCIDEDAHDHLCDICGREYPICKDANLDHACDACGEEMGSHADTNADHACEYGCGVAIGTCEDADTDHTCDYGCGKNYGEHVAASGKHTCDYCQDRISSCKDDNGDHHCDVCLEGIGHNYADTWTSDKDHHWHACSCGDKTDVLPHTPGTPATETAAQTCTVCGVILAPATESGTPPTTSDKDGGLPAGAVVAITVGSVAAAEIAVFAVWWFGIRKKTLADLCNACKRIAR